jgi:hypothetical protein
VTLRWGLFAAAALIGVIGPLGAPLAYADVRISGPEKVVFDWSTQRCEDWSIPDAPARAFRSSDGRVHLWLSHFQTRSMIGSDFDHLQIDCRINFEGLSSSDPAMYSDRQWLTAPYTLDGRNVYALVHSEYQGWRFGLCPSSQVNACWYNSIRFARSTDGGDTFREGFAPQDLVATIPIPYAAGAGLAGMFQPSNIVKSPKDGYYYAMARVITPGNLVRGSCVMRTKNLPDPKTWRGWNGSRFSVSFVDPYREVIEPASDHLCMPVAPAQIQEMIESLTYNTYLRRFLLVGQAVNVENGSLVWGFYYSTSSDLIHWSQRQLLMPATFRWSTSCPTQEPITNPALIDHSSTSRSFETTSQGAYLYYTRYHYIGCLMTLDRDLVRVPITITK